MTYQGNFQDNYQVNCPLWNWKKTSVYKCSTYLFENALHGNGTIYTR